jgi:hypothetical protein
LRFRTISVRRFKLFFGKSPDIFQEIDMPCLIEAFKQMRDRGLIAKRECYCEHCGQEIMLQEVQQSNDKTEYRGFVHVGGWTKQSSQEDFRVPLVFGRVKYDTIVYHDPACLEVGEVVANCLDQQGIRYEWDRTPGSPILVLADDDLSGVPGAGLHHAIEVDENIQTFRVPMYPESMFDKVGRNPVRLLNVTKLRRKMDIPHMRGPVKRPRVGDEVTLGFLAADAFAPQAREKYGELINRMRVESMCVEVTSVLGNYPACVYRGELLNAPDLIDPAVLRIGSPVNFTFDQVFPVERSSKSRWRR